MGVIYLRTNKVNGKKYVGQAVDIEQRQRTWKSINHYAGKAIYNARNKYGIDAFDFEILKECEDEELNQWEMYYIKELNTKVPNGYNMTDGGEASWIKGKHLSEEHKRKIGDGNKDKKRSEESKRKWSEAHKGKLLSEGHRSKISEALKGRKPSKKCILKSIDVHKGKPLTEEIKKKISETKKGIPNIKLAKPVLQIDKKTNEVISEFPSVSEVERQLGIPISNVSNCCNGKRKSTGGFKWQYK